MSKVTAKCKHCKKKFTTYRKDPRFCSSDCSNLHNYTLGKNHPFRKRVKCKHCSKPFSLSKIDIHEAMCYKYDKECKMCGKKWRANHDQMPNIFCSRSCSTIYNNSHKKKGIRRSKLECFLEKELLKLYPLVDLEFNKVNDMGFELDIFIPSLKLAFEINGIVHYKNIYGQEKYERIKNNDRNKMIKCVANGINLIVLDTMEQSKFNEPSSQKYLNTIREIIDLSLSKKEKPSD